MRNVPKSFYNSAAWKRCRELYLQQHPLCEDCLQRGEYRPAEHVHHIIWLDESNYTDPEISLNWRNLRAVCIDCHNREHSREQPRRWRVDEAGRIAPQVAAE